MSDQCSQPRLERFLLQLLLNWFSKMFSARAVQVQETNGWEWQWRDVKMSLGWFRSYLKFSLSANRLSGAWPGQLENRHFESKNQIYKLQFILQNHIQTWDETSSARLENFLYKLLPRSEGCCVSFSFVIYNFSSWYLNSVFYLFVNLLLIYC